MRPKKSFDLFDLSNQRNVRTRLLSAGTEDSPPTSRYRTNTGKSKTMKPILFALTVLLSANATADTVDECRKLEAFRANQTAKLALSRFGLGLITAAQLDVQRKAIREKGKVAADQCGTTKVATK